MFGKEKDDLVELLNKMQRSVCNYDTYGFMPGELDEISPPLRCDCKYGANDLAGMDESNGCPELRLATLLFAHMHKDEYDTLCARSGVVIPDRIFLKGEDE